MNEWKIIHDMDDEETGEPTCWCKEINHSKYGTFVWITLFSEGKYHVEYLNDITGDFITLVVCKSLSSAKRWVTMNI